MEKKNNNEELKLKKYNEASAKSGNISRIGKGPNDCMLREVFDILSDRGTISKTIYVCSYGCVNGSDHTYKDFNKEKNERIR